MLVVVLLLSIQKSFSQSQHLYTLSQLTDSAVQYYPALMSKQALIGSAKAAITDAKHAALPFLKVHDQLTMATANGVTGTFLPLGIAIPTAGGITSDNNSQAAAGNLGLIYSEYELYNFGLNKARIEDARVFEKYSEADYSKDMYLLKLNIARYYLALLKNSQQLTIEEDNVKRYETLFNVIKAETQSGLKPGVDSSLAKAELSKARINYNNKTEEIVRLKEQLSMLTGVKADVLQVDTAVQKFNSLVYNNNFSLLADTLNNPLIDYYRKEKDLYISNETLIKKSYQPKILLAGGFWGRGSSINYKDQYQPLGTGFGYQRYNYAMGLAFTYNLFDGIHRKDKLAINKYNIQASDYTLQQQQLYLNNSIQQSIAAIAVIEKNLHEIPIQLHSATDAYAQKVSQYQAGLINLIDLTNSAFVLYRSQTDYVQTLTSWLQANLDKAAAGGNIDSFIQTLK